MAEVREYTSTWTGFTGSPGYTKFRFTGPSFSPGVGTLSTAIGTFWDAVHFVLPANVVITTTKDYKTMDSATGALLDQGTDAGAVSTWTGAVAGGFSATSGACLGLDTTTIAGTRRVRGRIFLVPLGGGEYEADGTLLADGISRILAAANALKATAAGSWCVWHLPVAGAGGVAAPITGVHVKDRAAVLRSRRQ